MNKKNSGRKKAGNSRSSNKLFRQKKSSAIGTAVYTDIDYKNIPLLQKCVTDCGRILPARVLCVSRKYQRKIARSIKIARTMGLMPYCS